MSVAAHDARRVVLLGASLVLIAFNLRTAVVSIGPVLRETMAANSLSPLGASILTTIPPICFGIVAPASPLLARRLGLERALLAVLIALTVGSLLRGLDGSAALFVGQIMAMLAIGVMNVLLPGVVKRDFPARVASITGLYTMALSAGSAVAAGVTAPVYVATGSAATALAIWAAPTAVAAAIWAVVMPPRSREPARPPAWFLWRDRLAWEVTLFMGLQSSLAYLVFGWLPAMLRERGMDTVSAGLVLTANVVASTVLALVAPSLATRGSDQRLANAACAVVCVIALLGCMFAPLPTVWGWTIVLGLAQGGLIAIALTLIVLRAPDAHTAASLSGMAQGVGYIIACAGPLLAGLLRSWTGGWLAVGGLVVVLGAGCTLSGLGAGRNLLVGQQHQPKSA